MSALDVFGYGIDLLAVLPTYVAIFIPEAYALVDVRVLRLLRVFRIFKLSHFALEYSSLAAALTASRQAAPGSTGQPSPARRAPAFARHGTVRRDGTVSGLSPA